MRPISAGERSRLQMTQVEAMPDACVILYRSSGAADGYGHPTPVWTESQASPCGFGEQRRSEVLDTGQVGVKQSTVRLPISLTVSRVDRIKITHRFGEAITPVVYEIVGGPHVGPSGILVEVKAIGDV